MSDDKSKIRQDRFFVDIHDPNEIRDWTKHFDITNEELIAAVKEVGPSVKKLTEYFDKKKK